MKLEKGRGRPKNEFEKAKTMLFCAEIESALGSNAVLIEEKLMPAGVSNPAGSNWRRYRTGARAMPEEHMFKIVDKAISLRLIKKKTGFVPGVSVVETVLAQRSMEGLKAERVITSGKAKGGQKVIAEARSAIRRVSSFLGGLDENDWTCFHDMCRSGKGQFELYEFWAKFKEFDSVLAEIEIKPLSSEKMLGIRLGK